MKKLSKIAFILAGMLVLSVSACKKEEPVKDPAPAEQEAAQPADKAEAPAEAPKADAPEIALDQLDRTAFNHAAQRLNLPIFWKYEETPSKTVRPEVLTTLNFFPDAFNWKDENGKFTKDF